MTFYRHILKKAWEITWKLKFLWFFGIFAALLGNGGEYEIITKTFIDDGQTQLFPNLSTIASTGIFTPQGLKNVLKTAQTDPINFAIVILFLLVFLALSAFLVWLVVVCQASLVGASAKYIQNKKPVFKDSIQSGIGNFWPVFTLNLINRIILTGVFTLLLIPILMSFRMVSLTYIAAFIILIPAAIFISFLIKYSIGYVVIKGQGTMESIRSGWELFKANWLVSIEMALLLALINLGLGIIAILLILIIAIPFLFLAAVFLNLAFKAGFWLVMILGLLSFIGLIVLTGAIIATFQVSAWTGLFLELINKGGVSKIVRIFSRENTQNSQ
ncbi:MAG: hypothetical protein WCW77_02470 [Patescibacteria group bacterium]|jgi:hypothetical protein